MRTPTFQQLPKIFVPTFFLVLLFLVEIASAQVQTNVTIQTNDGITLEATLTYPLAIPPSGGYPGIVLVHGFGGSKDDMNTVALYVATEGYASIAYSVRGQGGSGGLSTVDGKREQSDLQEIIEFFREESQIDPDKIGVAGGSQGGIHAWMAAAHNMSGVRAVASLVATPDFARALVPNGCVKYGLPYELTLESVRYDPIRDRMQEFIITDEYDSVLYYIDERNLASLVDSIQIPVFQGLGWADFLFPVNGGIRARQQLAARGIPVWSYFGTNGHGESENEQEAAFVLEKAVAWFNRWLKGSALEQDTVPMVFYSDDRPEWPRHTSLTWPPEETTSFRLYFTQNGLQESQPEVGIALPFFLNYSPEYTPEMGWNDLYGGVAFTNAFSSISSKVVSNALPQDIEITGIPVGQAFLQSDAGKFQAHMRLYDIEPTDTGDVWHLLSRSINGVRNNTPEQVHHLAFEGTALSHIVPAGHQLGVEITSLDLLSENQANTIPYFASSQSLLLSSPAQQSYIDLPIVGTPLTAVGDHQPAIPNTISLQNYPNPFNPRTIIEFSLVKGGNVKLNIYDALGREVMELLNVELEAGAYKVNFDGSALASGIYLCRIQAGTSSKTQRLLLLK